MNMFLIVSTIVLIINIFILVKECIRKNKTKITYAYIFYSIISCIILTSTILQKFTTSPLLIKIYHQLIAGGLYLAPSLILILYLIFINKRIKKKFTYFIILIFPISLILLSLTNDYHHLLYREYALNYFDRKRGILYAPSIAYVYGTILADYLILLIANFKKNNILKSKVFKIFIVTLFTIIIPILFYTGIIKSNNYIPSLILTLHGIFSYFIIIRYKYINAIPFGMETAINFINTPLVVIDVHGEIVYSNIIFKYFIKNVLGIFLEVTNIFKFLYAFDRNLTNELRAAVKQIYKIKGNINKYVSLYGLNEKINLQITIQEIKKTNYYLLVFRNINQQIQEISDIKSKQNIINVQSQLATVGELALGVVHDINTPITALNTAINLLEQTPLTSKEKEIVDTLKTSASKIAVITSSIKDQFKNADSTEKVSFNLTNFIEQTVFNIQRKLADANCKTKLKLEDNIILNGNPSKLTQIMLNILFNSINAYTPLGGGDIYIETFTEQDNAYIKIKDFAGGIPEELRPHIFKNILTTKGTKGFGLGLYIANSIIQAEFNGKLEFNCENNSTTIFIIIPMKGED